MARYRIPLRGWIAMSVPLLIASAALFVPPSAATSRGIPLAAFGAGVATLELACGVAAALVVHHYHNRAADFDEEYGAD